MSTTINPEFGNYRVDFLDGSYALVEAFTALQAVAKAKMLAGRRDVIRHTFLKHVGADERRSTPELKKYVSRDELLFVG